MKTAISVALMAACLAIGWGAGWLSGNSTRELQAVSWLTNASLLINDSGMPRTPAEGQNLSAGSLVVLTLGIAPDFDKIDSKMQESIKRYAISLSPHMDVLPTGLHGRDEAVAMIKCIAEAHGGDAATIATCSQAVAAKFAAISVAEKSAAIAAK